jgi:hypothetical protein
MKNIKQSIWKLFRSEKGVWIAIRCVNVDVPKMSQCHCTTDVKERVSSQSEVQFLKLEARIGVNGR